jgi:hypothetical protein
MSGSRITAYMGHDSRFLDARDKLQKLFSSYTASAQKASNGERRHHVADESDNRCSCWGDSATSTLLAPRVPAAIFPGKLQAEMNQRGTNATFLWCSYAAITRVMAALVIQLLEGCTPFQVLSWRSWRQHLELKNIEGRLESLIG